jgi:hypothetical protein
MRPSAPDLLVDIELLPTHLGGRVGPTLPDRFGCPVSIDGEYFDARFDLSAHGSLLPGHSLQAVPLKFLSPHLALPLITVGKVMPLWEGRTIGHAKVTSIQRGV